VLLMCSVPPRGLGAGPGRGEAGARTSGQRVARPRAAGAASASRTSTLPEEVFDPPPPAGLDATQNDDGFASNY